jgi:hypothetical protein
LEIEGELLLNSVVVASRDQVYCNLNGEAVILSLSSGMYYGLDPVGARIWDLVQEPKAVVDVVEALLEEYKVDRNQCERDLLALLQELASQDLISTRPLTKEV